MSWGQRWLTKHQMRVGDILFSIAVTHVDHVSRPAVDNIHADESYQYRLLQVVCRGGVHAFSTAKLVVWRKANPQPAVMALWVHTWPGLHPSSLAVIVSDSQQCIGYCILSLFYASPILQCINRGNMRAQYGINGNACTDCLTSCFCPCCGLQQEHSEAEERSLIQRYQPQPQMVYQQPIYRG